MPVLPNTPVAEPHRPLYPLYRLYLDAAVARRVSKQERQSNPKAQSAMQKEWDRLRDIGCWDESQVYEWSELASWARAIVKLICMLDVYLIFLSKRVLSCLGGILRVNSRVELFFRETMCEIRIGIALCFKICRALRRPWALGKQRICMGLSRGMLPNSRMLFRRTLRLKYRGCLLLFVFLANSGPSHGPTCATPFVF